MEMFNGCQKRRHRVQRVTNGVIQGVVGSVVCLAAQSHTPQEGNKMMAVALLE